jgi:hypothetical protein
MASQEILPPLTVYLLRVVDADDAVQVLSLLGTTIEQTQVLVEHGVGTMVRQGLLHRLEYLPMAGMGVNQ